MVMQDPPTPPHSGLHTQTHPHAGFSADTQVSSVDIHHRSHVGRGGNRGTRRESEVEK